MTKAEKIFYERTADALIRLHPCLREGDKLTDEMIMDAMQVVLNRDQELLDEVRGNEHLRDALCLMVYNGCGEQVIHADYRDRLAEEKRQAQLRTARFMDDLTHPA